MPESDSENDIWEYRSLRKTRRSKPRAALSHCAPSRGAGRTGSHREPRGIGSTAPSCPSSRVCPSCQIPFSILLGQSPQWHVSECLEDSRPKDECPNGLLCSSGIPSHYRKYSHLQLAHSRATAAEGLVDVGSSPQDAPSISKPGLSPGWQSSPDPPARVSSNALLCLRSPTVKDSQKKKGWSPSLRSGKPVIQKQDATSTPLKVSGVRRAVPVTPSPTESASVQYSSGEQISFSPISSFPMEAEVSQSKEISFRKTLFSGDAKGIKTDNEDLNDSIASSEPLTQPEYQEDRKVLAGSHSQEDYGRLVNSLAPANCLLAGVTGVESSLESGAPVLKLEEEEDMASGARDRALDANDGHRRSPQSLVLEKLQDQLLSRAECSIQKESKHEALEHPQGQNFNMAPRKTEVKPISSTLRQMDIGVFFGLRPLKKEEPKPQPEVAPAVENVMQVTPISVGRHTAGGRKKRKGTSPLGDESEVAEAGCAPVPETGRAVRPQRKRWAYRRACEDGLGRVKRCPFYKKIPGTGFVVDAFQYGPIDGATCYFLTHFHSDHYNGLTKSSKLPVYCNRITGSLLKTKLQVAEQYLHILPMNTEVMVEGVRVVLLDANHCPGAAMLLFLLPDGQTVLHTGDFRAGPSMECYPVLQECRVQTLYLDTTYCSPEYSFPSQQEVITFAANVAFEHVTLYPRTLVVCGAYAVGKEKVFLALAEVLGSKVAMSKDKFKTMSCLELDQISQLITTDWVSARVHVLPMMQLNLKGLHTHLRKFSGTYDRVLVFKPTGWTFSSQAAGVEDIQPQVKDNITTYEIPYSEHSSYLELKRFVQWLKPGKIIPTVNAGSWASRRAMERMFSDWRAEHAVSRGGPGTRSVLAE